MTSKDIYIYTYSITINELVKKSFKNQYTEDILKIAEQKSIVLLKEFYTLN